MRGNTVHQESYRMPPGMRMTVVISDTLEFTIESRHGPVVRLGRIKLLKQTNLDHKNCGFEQKSDLEPNSNSPRRDPRFHARTNVRREHQGERDAHTHTRMHTSQPNRTSFDRYRMSIMIMLSCISSAGA